MARTILVDEENPESVYVGNTGDGEVEVFSTEAEGEEIIVVEGDIELSATFNDGGDIIYLPGEAEEYTALVEGSRLILVSAVNDVVISIPINPNTSNTIVFGEDDEREVGGQADGDAFVGDQVIERDGTAEQLESDQGTTVPVAITEFVEAQEALDEFEEDNGTVAELEMMEEECEDELAEARDEESDAELENRAELERAEADNAEADVAEIPGGPAALAELQEAQEIEAAAEERETQAQVEVAAAEARYESFPENEDIVVADNGTVNEVDGDELIILQGGQLVLNEGVDEENNPGITELLEAVREREAAERAENTAEGDREDAELALDLLEESDSDAAVAARQDQEDFEEAVIAFNEALDEYEDDPTATNAAELEAAFEDLNDESEGRIFTETGLTADSTAAEIEAEEPEIRDAIANERTENSANIVAAELADPEEDGAVARFLEEDEEADDAEEELEDRQLLIAECEELEELVEEGQELEMARDEAAQAAEDDAEADNIEIVREDDEDATAGDDLFILTDDSEATITDFGEEGDDRLFLYDEDGQEYTVVFLPEGTELEGANDESVGDNDVLEAFVIQTDEGTMIYLEAESEDGNDDLGLDFDGGEVLLEGVDAGDLMGDNSFIMMEDSSFA